MTVFEIISVCISFLLLLTGIIGVYIKTQVDIAKINTALTFLQKDLDRKEVSICKLEKDNKEDHKEILTKIDKLISKDNV